jgi:hypothetical protein
MTAAVAADLASLPQVDAARFEVAHMCQTCVFIVAVCLQVLLMSVEVAMEYLMGLTTSPHVEQLQVTMRELAVYTDFPASKLFSRTLQQLLWLSNQVASSRCGAAGWRNMSSLPCSLH